MHTLENAKLKALIKLLETESETYGPVLKGELAAAIKENPLQVQSFIEEEFKTSAPRPVLDALEEICWEDLATALTKFCPACGANTQEEKKSVCPACGAAVKAGAKFCGECGCRKPEAPALWDCPECGNRGIRAKFCPECGHKRER